MCECFCLGFIYLVVAGNTLIDYSGLFSPHDFKKNDLKP